MRSYSLIPVLLSLFLTSCGPQGPKAGTASRIDALCSAVFEGAPSTSADSLAAGAAAATPQPGAAVLIMRGGRTLFEKCYGCADLETGAPITPATSFNIASVSKQFTAVAVLQLVEQGRISLDDPVSRYFPEFESDIWEKVRIRHLLSHSSGVPDARKGLTRQERIFGNDSLAVAYMISLDYLHFEPGTQYEYMNPTFVLLARIVERVSGEEFTQYVHDHIFAPSGMDATLYFDPAHQDLIPAMSHAYRQRREGTWKEYDYGEETFFATKPDGGIYTSIREFAKWEMAQRRSLVLKPETLADAQSAHILVSGSPWCDYQNRPDTWYGYGWFIEMPANDPGTAGETATARISSGTGTAGEVAEAGCSLGHHGKVVYHTGDNGGYQILAARYPTSKTLILIFANRSDWDRWQLLQDIEDLIF